MDAAPGGGSGRGDPRAPRGGVDRAVRARNRTRVAVASGGRARRRRAHARRARRARRADRRLARAPARARGRRGHAEQSKLARIRGRRTLARCAPGSRSCSPTRPTPRPSSITWLATAAAVMALGAGAGLQRLRRAGASHARLREVVDLAALTGDGWGPKSELGASPIVAPVAPAADRTAVLAYTSGTTGKPKAVPLSEANLVARFAPRCSRGAGTPTTCSSIRCRCFTSTDSVGCTRRSCRVRAR